MYIEKLNDTVPPEAARADLRDERIRAAGREGWRALTIATVHSLTRSTDDSVRGELLLEVTHECGITTNAYCPFSRTGTSKVAWGEIRQEAGTLPRLVDC